MKAYTFFLTTLVSQPAGLGKKGSKVAMKRNLILNQRSRFISKTKIGLSFSPCCCLFWMQILEAA